MLALLLLLTTSDPRIAVTELQLEGRYEEALRQVDADLAEEPETARRLGFDYLQGHLLETLGRGEDAQRAFARAIGSLRDLAGYSRYRLALNQLDLGHPEVAAGLLAMVLENAPRAALATLAVPRLIQALRTGGDCRLLEDLDRWRIPAGEHRALRLARADCALAAGAIAGARRELLELVQDSPEDETARAAAERLDRLQAEPAADSQLDRLLGRVFFRHRQFELSVTYLGRGLGGAAGWTDRPGSREELDTLFALARSNFWRGNYILAASQFGRLAAAAPAAQEKARALYQQGRCYDLSGNWDAAAKSYRLSYLANPDGGWADAALVSAMRLEWRTGEEDPALELFELLGTKRSWQSLRGRAALFLAASDLVRGRADRAGSWLGQVPAPHGAVPPELSYWRGRLAELQGRPTVLEHYFATLAADPFHPLAHAAVRRLEAAGLTDAARARARDLARADRARDLYAAWLVLGDRDPLGAQARAELVRRLRADARVRPLLDLEPRPPAEWPLWRATLSEPEELLLALGVWDQGAPAVGRHFPITDPSLAFTGSSLLASAREFRPSLRVAEVLAKRAPPELPAALLPRPLRLLLYPFPYREAIQREASLRGIDPFLLAALIREESRFDPSAVSAASARGLTQFVLPTARRLAPRLGVGELEAADLFDPEVSIALGAAYLTELSARFGNQDHLVLAAYNAGEDQAQVWLSYCYSREPEEYLTKVGFPETRAYLEKVLASRAQYAELYGAAAAAR